MLFSLFWKRITKEGAIAGMITGGVSVFLWEFVFTKFLASKIAFFGIYELLPAFILSSIVIVVVSLLTKEPDGEIIAEFERAKKGEIEETPVEA
jgi:sodium/proline symporter